MGQRPARRLYRSRRQRMLAGVAGGIAQYLGVDPTLVRVAWVVGAMVALPAAVVLYVALALVVPLEPEGP